MAADKPARIFLTSGSTSSAAAPSPEAPFPAPTPPPPEEPPDEPFAPTLARERFSSDFERCSFSFSARSRYSVNLFRMSALSLSFFSSVGRASGRAIIKREGRCGPGCLDERDLSHTRSRSKTHISWPSRNSPTSSDNSYTPPTPSERSHQRQQACPYDAEERTTWGRTAYSPLVSYSIALPTISIAFCTAASGSIGRRPSVVPVDNVVVVVVVVMVRSLWAAVGWVSPTRVPGSCMSCKIAVRFVTVGRSDRSGKRVWFEVGVRSNGGSFRRERSGS